MSKYTTELRFICEYYAGLQESAGYNSINEIIENSWQKIFDFSFPIFDENYRKVLCINIIKHFYTREICAETVGRWKLFLDSKMNLIMDKYNKLYKINLTDFNPLYDVDYSRTYTKGNEGKQKNDAVSTITTTDKSTSDNTSSQEGTAETEGGSKSGFSDTPQGALTGVESGTYLTNATVSSTDSTTESSQEITGHNVSDSTSKETGGSTNTIDINNIEKYTEHVIGQNGSVTYGTMIKDFRENMIDVDCMIIEELEPLFMGIY